MFQMGAKDYEYPVISPIIGEKAFMDQYPFHKLYVFCLKQLRKDRFGFTFIEIMIAIAIVGTLAAIAIPNYISYKKKAEGNVAVRDIKRIDDAINVYVVENGELPDSLDDIGLGDLKDP
ncbi:MAG: prepilin-type N-terminal cleavage/methylation domain-containing protein, partial [Deltaproteobacteria bacterium]|nr:prepilin-type N-terminal cleavage/methylation domain-containing protein [Deltaproteobacteria bacterium]